MSNIIKSGRIRSQSVLDLSSRILTSHQESSAESETDLNPDEAVSAAISQREEELARLEDLAQQTLLEAQRQAEEMINAAAEKAKKIEAEAREKESYMMKETYHKQEEILCQAESEVHRIREAAEEEKSNMLKKVESEVVETMIVLMQHIISEELTYHPKWMKWIVRKMLFKEEISNKVTLIVSDKNMLKISEQQDEWLADLYKLEAIKADESLNDTTCILDTGQGKIEYDVSKGMDKVIAELRILKSLA